LLDIARRRGVELRWASRHYMIAEDAYRAALGSRVVKKLLIKKTMDPSREGARA
jgi:hypothetical protein